MSYYSNICGICPDKVFIEPGSETTKPRHDGAHSIRRNADHIPTVLPLAGEVAQRRMLARALEIVREQAPQAVSVQLTVSDQDCYGFVLEAVLDESGQDLLPDWFDGEHPLAGLRDAVVNELNDLDWDGVVGENSHGDVTIDLRGVVADR